MENTIIQVFMGDTFMYHLARAQYHVDPLYAAWIDLLTEMNWSDERGAFAGTNGDPTKMAEAMERWNQTVIDTVPADRQLVCGTDGRLGAALRAAEVPVPDGPVPNVNDTENFQKNLIMGPAIVRSTPWWESLVSWDRPRSGRPDRQPLRPRAPRPGAGG